MRINNFLNLYFAGFLCTGLFLGGSTPALALVSKLPLMQLNTGGEVIADEDSVEARVSILSGEKNSSSELLRMAPELAAKVKIRGYSSAKWLKHQYSLQLHDPKDPERDADVSLLGLPAHHNWVLAAPYSDRSLIRNAFAFDLARSLGTSQHPFWAPHTRAIELFLNGQYQGVYYLTEKPDYSKARLDLGKTDLAHPEQSPFMVKLEHSKGTKPEEYFTTPANSKVLFEEPSAKKIAKYKKEDPAHTKRLVAHIQNVMNRFEQSVLAINDGDFSSYRKMIDSDSFVNFILVQEVLKNLDGFRRSMNVHFKDGLLHMGPVWDFDLTLANIQVFGEMRPEGFQSGHGWYIDGNPELFWFKTMMQDPAFHRALVQRYRDLRRPGQALSTAALLGEISRLTGNLGAAAGRNFTVWNPNMEPQDGPLYFFIPKYSDFHYSYAVIDLRNFLLRRLAWLDDNISQIGSNPWGFQGDAAGSAGGGACTVLDQSDATQAMCSLVE